MNRTGWLGVLLLTLLVAGAAARLAWPAKPSLLPCGPEEVRWVGPPGEEIARCGPPTLGRAPPAGVVLTLDGKLELNRATEEELALLPGVGRALARRLVRAREELGTYSSWDQVDEVSGIGAAKLEMLQRYTTLGPSPPVLEGTADGGAGVP